MPFKKNPIVVPPHEDLVTKRIVNDYDEDGNFITKVILVDECRKEGVDYREYSLRHQLESGDTIKQVRTDLLGDDFDSITTEMVQPYFDEPND